MEKLQWKTEVRKLSDLIPVSYNPRSLSDKQAKDLKKSLLKFSLAEIPVINLDNTILAGHQRCKILAQIEGKDFEIDVRVPNRQLTPEEADEYLIRSNKNSGEFDFELLENHFSIDDLVDWGFDEDEFEHDVDNLGEVEGEDDVPDAPEEPVTKLGDVWLLGDHRLLCGDATSVDAVDKLMDGQKADMVFTDPPYNIDSSGAGKGSFNRALNKQKDDIEFISSFQPSDFLAVLPLVFKKGCINSYIFCNADLLPDYLTWAKESKYSFNVLVWKKPNAIPINAAHRPDIEYLLLFRKSSIFNHGIKDVNYSRVIECSRVTGLHPTMKPVEIIENQVRISSNKGGNVIDLFGGSGSTLIACEKTKRKCFMMELDETYCDVIIKRWQEFTGNEAVHAESGKKYNELLHQA